MKQNSRKTLAYACPCCSRLGGLVKHIYSFHVRTIGDSLVTVIAQGYYP